MNTWGAQESVVLDEAVTAGGFEMEDGDTNNDGANGDLIGLIIGLSVLACCLIVGCVGFAYYKGKKRGKGYVPNEEVAELTEKDGNKTATNTQLMEDEDEIEIDVDVSIEK